MGGWLTAQYVLPLPGGPHTYDSLRTPAFRIIGTITAGNMACIIGVSMRTCNAPVLKEELELPPLRPRRRKRLVVPLNSRLNEPPFGYPPKLVWIVSIRTHDEANCWWREPPPRDVRAELAVGGGCPKDVRRNSKDVGFS